MYTQRVINNLKKALEEENHQVHTAFDLIHLLVVIVSKIDSLSQESKRSLLLNVIDDIIAGADGVLYTEDDLLPPHVTDGLRALIKSNLLFATLDFMGEMTQTKKTCSLLSCLCTCLGTKTPQTVTQTRQQTQNGDETRAPLIQRIE